MRTIYILLMALAMLCTPAFCSLEAASADASQRLSTTGPNIIDMSSRAQADNLAGNYAGATNELFTATAGSAYYNQNSGIKQAGCDDQIGEVGNTAVVLAARRIVGDQDGSTNQAGAKDSSATGTSLAVLQAGGDIKSSQNLDMNGYGRDVANYDAEQALIADSLCGNVNAGQGTKIVSDPKHINGFEDQSMSVAAGGDANLGQDINAILGATESVNNVANNEMDVKTGDDANLKQATNVNERLWGNSPSGVGINILTNNIGVRAGDDLNALQKAVGTTTTGNKAIVIGSAFNGLSGTVGDDSTASEIAKITHYIV